MSPIFFSFIASARHFFKITELFPSFGHEPWPLSPCLEVRRALFSWGLHTERLRAVLSLRLPPCDLGAGWALISQEFARKNVFMLEGYSGILKSQLCLSKIARTGLLGWSTWIRLPRVVEVCYSWPLILFLPNTVVVFRHRALKKPAPRSPRGRLISFLSCSIQVPVRTLLHQS